ncbi:hypothetical protein EJB05_45312, partial [Eragrostis curvula]
MSEILVLGARCPHLPPPLLPSRYNPARQSPSSSRPGRGPILISSRPRRGGSCRPPRLRLAASAAALLPAVVSPSSAMHHHHHPSRVFRAEQQGAGGGYHHHHNIGDGAIPPELPRSPNPSSKSSSNLTAATFATPLAAAVSLLGFAVRYHFRLPRVVVCDGGALFLVQYGGVAASLGMSAPGMAATEVGRFCQPWPQFENWGDSGIVVTSPLAETTSTDIDDSGDKHNAQMGGGGGAQRVDPSVVSKERQGEHKIQRRLAQNREAARKSRIRKKAYIEHLESSRGKLLQLEEELKRARQQGMFIASGCSGGDHGHSTSAFDAEYARWLDEHQRHINDLRAALAASGTAGDGAELRAAVDGVMSHHEQAYRLKSAATKADVFHVLSGMWLSPAERLFMWVGGHRPSEVLKAVASGGGLELTERQLAGVCGLQQSSMEAEDALSQGMDALQRGLAELLANAAAGAAGGGADSVTNYVGQMAMAMAKLGTLEHFVRQGDLLRQQTLQEMRRTLNTRQTARALLIVNDYFSRLRALSSLWLARPRDV